MSRKLVITYSSNPQIGDKITYNIYVGGELLVYQNLEPQMSLTYENVDEPVRKVKIQPTLNQTLQNTVSFLNEYYPSTRITYSVVDDTIEILVQGASGIAFLSTPSVNFTQEVIDIDNSEILNMKYFLKYTNIVNDTYECRIYNKNYFGDSKEVQGSISFSKGQIKDHLDVIRGYGASIALEANLELTYEDLYSDNEQDFPVRIYKNSKIFFIGYLKPDGIFQSFTRDNWIINLECIDGLGALKNLSFVKDNGFRFVGKLKAFDIIYSCLKRTGFQLNINTSINIFYDGLTPSDTLDILTKTGFNSDRFFKEDDKTIMSCEEVLTSILDCFSACITQQNGEWYIYKPNELYFDQIVKFKRYSINGGYEKLNAVNLYKKIGSNIDDFYPHHCGGDQRIEIKGAVNAYRINYKYGLVSSLSDNPNLERDGLNYEGWNVLQPSLLVDNPSIPNGINVVNKDYVPGIGSGGGIIISNALTVEQDDLISFGIDWSVLGSSFFTGRFIQMKIKVGAYYLKYVGRNDRTPISEANDLSVWTTVITDVFGVYLDKTGSFTFNLPPIPVNGDLTFEILQTYNNGGTTLISRFDIKPNMGNSQIGEFHTVQRKDKISSLIKENKTIFNGDNIGLKYVGAIFKENLIDTTITWFRRNNFESKPILQIAAEEGLRMQQKPLQMFSGSLYGYVPYLSVIEINNLKGFFMFITYNYDTISNITKGELLQLFSEDLPDLDYKFTYDFGTTVKPTITS